MYSKHLSTFFYFFLYGDKDWFLGGLVDCSVFIYITLISLYAKNITVTDNANQSGLLILFSSDTLWRSTVVYHCFLTRRSISCSSTVLTHTSPLQTHLTSHSSHLSPFTFHLSSFILTPLNRLNIPNRPACSAATGPVSQKTSPSQQPSKNSGTSLLLPLHIQN